MYLCNTLCMRVWAYIIIVPFFRDLFTGDQNSDDYDPLFIADTFDQDHF